MLFLTFGSFRRPSSLQTLQAMIWIWFDETRASELKWPQIRESLCWWPQTICSAGTSHEFAFAALETPGAKYKGSVNLEVGGAPQKLIFHGGLLRRFMSSETPIHCQVWPQTMKPFSREEGSSVPWMLPPVLWASLTKSTLESSLLLLLLFQSWKGFTQDGLTSIRWQCPWHSSDPSFTCSAEPSVCFISRCAWQSRKGWEAWTGWANGTFAAGCGVAPKINPPEISAKACPALWKPPVLTGHSFHLWGAGITTHVTGGYKIRTLAWRHAVAF